MSSRFRISVPASTSNLGSGFDTLSAALGLYLTVDVEVTEDGTGIEWVSGWPFPPEENIVDAALRSTADLLGLKNVGVRLSMDNPIPLKRGLGSSGAAIIAGIKIAEKLAGQRLSQEEILNLAYPLEGHPDNIAASLLGGWVLSCVKETEITAARIPGSLSCRFVLAIPKVTISTRQARQILPDSYSRADTVFNLQRCALFVHSLWAGQKELLRDASQDRLHQPFRATLVPGMENLLQLRDLPAELNTHVLSLTISGSGSSVIAIADGSYEEIACWMTGILRASGTEARSLVLDLDVFGARTLPLT
ncbi:MAG TPA: homoserine kinase [Acidobacteriota bacterium]|nr:homoserine kinase [Acidobacteriota bacterium]